MTARVSIEPVDRFDDATVAELHALLVAATAADTTDYPLPCPLELPGSLYFPWPGNTPEDYVARAAGRPVGLLRLLFPEEHAGRATVDRLVVHPDHRGRGVGRALCAHAAARALANGRGTLRCAVVEELPGGAPRDPRSVAFAEAAGATRASTLIRTRLDVSTVDPAARPPCPSGYSVVRWGTIAPDEFVQDTALLEELLDADPGSAEVAEPRQLDTSWIRAFEKLRAGRQRHAWQTAVRHTPTGRLVAWTVLSMAHSIPDNALQGVTAVHPAHRGQGLGLVVKLENLRHARAHEPHLRTIDTYTTVDNHHMIRINHTIGFRPVDALVTWQLTLPPAPGPE